MEKNNMKNFNEMSAVEIANYEFSFLNCSEKATEVRKVSILECESGKVLEAMGLLAQELCKALSRESDNLKINFKRELKELLDRYDFDMYIDFDSLGAGGWHESLLMVENRGFDCEHISFDLDDIVERKIHR